MQQQQRELFFREMGSKLELMNNLFQQLPPQLIAQQQGFHQQFMYSVSSTVNSPNFSEQQLFYIANEVNNRITYFSNLINNSPSSQFVNTGQNGSSPPVTDVVVEFRGNEEVEDVTQRLKRIHGDDTFYRLPRFFDYKAHLIPEPPPQPKPRPPSPEPEKGTQNFEGSSTFQIYEPNIQSKEQYISISTKPQVNEGSSLVSTSEEKSEPEQIRQQPIDENIFNKDGVEMISQVSPPFPEYLKVEGTLEVGEQLEVVCNQESTSMLHSESCSLVWERVQRSMLVGLGEERKVLRLTAPVPGQVKYRVTEEDVNFHLRVVLIQGDPSDLSAASQSVCSGETEVVMPAREDSHSFLLRSLRCSRELRGVPAGALQRAVLNMTRHKTKQGDTVIRQGDKPGPFYVIQSGACSVHVEGTAAGARAHSTAHDEMIGTTNVVCQLKAGDCFGGLALLHNTLRTATVQVDSERCCLWSLNVEAFTALARLTTPPRPLPDQVDKTLEFFKSLLLFSHFETPPQVLRAIAEESPLRTFTTRQKLILKGEPAASVFLLVSGWVSRVGGGGLRGPGDVVGGDKEEKAMSQHHPASVVALCPVQAVEVSLQDPRVRQAMALHHLKLAALAHALPNTDWARLSPDAHEPGVLGVAGVKTKRNSKRSDMVERQLRAGPAPRPAEQFPLQSQLVPAAVDSLREFLLAFRPTQFPPSQTLLMPGQTSQHFYAIQEGSMQIEAPGGGRYTELPAGQTVGSRSILSGEGAHAAVSAGPRGAACQAASAPALLQVRSKLVEIALLSELRHVVDLRGVSKAALQLLASSVETIIYQPGDHIVMEGGFGDHACVAHSPSALAHMELEEPEEDGKPEGEWKYFQLEPLEVFGDDFFYDKGAVMETVSVVAVKPTTCHWVPLDMLDLCKTMLATEGEEDDNTGPSPPALADGPEKEKLEVHGVLGEGPLGRVMLVREAQEPGHIFALKALSKALIQHKGQRKQIQQQKEMMERMHHPFMARLVRTFKDSVNVYLLMECCQGGELFKLVEEQVDHILPEAAAKFYVGCAALALDHMHSQMGVVYRDLKPENMVLDRRGYAKLVDFGFSKAVVGVLAGAPSATYTLCGTADYLAPEMVALQGHGLEVDLWALGVLAFELCAGRTPFSSSSGDHNQTYKAILTRQMEMPEWFSVELINFVEGLLRLSPEKRLGAGSSGIASIKSHPWFANFDWNALAAQTMPPPFKPIVNHSLDTSHFDIYNEDETICSTNEISGLLEEVF